MSSEERRFSGKVYSRRNRKDVSPATATDLTAPETKVSENEQPANVIDVPNDPFRQPTSVAAIANDEIVEREKRNRKPNRYYNSSDYLLEKDKLPFEIYKKSKKNKNETKNKGFAAGLKQGTSGEMGTSSHVEGVREADNGNSGSGSSSTEDLCY